MCKSRLQKPPSPNETLYRVLHVHCTFISVSNYVYKLYTCHVSCSMNCVLQCLQRAFLSAVMKALSSSKQMCEAATVCGVDMFKACAYVGDSSAPIFRYYLNLIQSNLQVRTNACAYMYLTIHVVLHGSKVVCHHITWLCIANSTQTAINIREVQVARDLN